jgi:hypothetical protein
VQTLDSDHLWLLTLTRVSKIIHLIGAITENSAFRRKTLLASKTALYSHVQLLFLRLYLRNCLRVIKVLVQQSDACLHK